MTLYYAGVNKKVLGNFDRGLGPHDVPDQTVDFIRRRLEASEIGAGRFIEWLEVTACKLYSWRERYGRANAHNGWIPRDFWLED